MKKSTEKKLDRLAELLKDQEPGAAERCIKACKKCECNGRHSIDLDDLTVEPLGEIEFEPLGEIELESLGLDDFLKKKEDEKTINKLARLLRGKTPEQIERLFERMAALLEDQAAGESSQ